MFDYDLSLRVFAPNENMHLIAETVRDFVNNLMRVSYANYDNSWYSASGEGELPAWISSYKTNFWFTKEHLLMRYVSQTIWEKVGSFVEITLDMRIFLPKGRGTRVHGLCNEEVYLDWCFQKEMDAASFDWLLAVDPSALD